MLKRIALLCFSLACTAYGETLITGGIGGKIFDTIGNPYIVTGDIIVERGATTVIKAGSIFLFSRFSGMIVEGNLNVEGTMDNPVVFSCSNDGSYARTAAQTPNPYDWNGILVAESADSVTMSNFILAYSVYGLKSKKGAMYIQNAVFKANGQFNLTINDTIKLIEENVPYSYGIAPSYHNISAPQEAPVAREAPVVQEAPMTREAPVAQESPAPPEEPLPAVESSAEGESAGQRIASRNTIPLSVGAGAVGIGAGAVCGLFVSKLLTTQERLSKERDPQNASGLERTGDKQTAVSIVSGAVCAISIPVAIYYIVRHKRQSHAMTGARIIPVIGGETVGVMVSADL